MGCELEFTGGVKVGVGSLIVKGPEHHGHKSYDISSRYI